MMCDKVKCPTCEHVFDSDETFSWDIDDAGHPTIVAFRRNAI
jgi:hypothetical protein